LLLRDEGDFLEVLDVYHQLIDPIKQPSEYQGIWHKKEIIRNILSYTFYENEEFNEKFGSYTFQYKDEHYSKDLLEVHYKFLLSLPIIEQWSSTRQFKKIPSDATKETYQRSIRVFFRYLASENVEINSFKIEDVEDFFSQLKVDKFSSYYINKLYFALLHFVRYMKPELEHDFIEFVRVSTPPKLLEIAPKSVDKSTLMQLKKYLETSIMNAETKIRRYEAVRNNCIITLMFETGVRLSEITQLDVESVLGGQMLVDGKGNKQRSIPLNSICKRVLANYLEVRTLFVEEHKLDETTPIRDKRGILREPIHPLFYSNQNKRLSSRSIARIFEKVEGLHPHLSRHTFITSMVRNQFDLPLIQNISGHSNLNMISRYSRPSQADMLRALEKNASQNDE
jgi:integrase/recombinase XerC/integrase/recombinase XerD